MKYVTVLFWSVLIGQAVDYIGSALLGGTYDFTSTVIVSLIAGLILCIMPLAMPKDTDIQAEKKETV